MHNRTLFRTISSPLLTEIKLLGSSLFPRNIYGNVKHICQPGCFEQSSWNHRVHIEIFRFSFPLLGEHYMIDIQNFL